jgi:hypothetical protein
MCFVESNALPKCRHETREAAIAEAERLAKKTGQRVAVIECLSITTCKAIQKVEWDE